MTDILPIDAVEVIPVDIVPERKRRMSTGAYAYGDGTSWVGRPVLVAVRAGGLTGWGQVRANNPFVGETAASMVTNVRDFYGPLLIGRNVFEIDRLWHDCQAKLPGNAATMSMLDMAFHDLVGKAVGLPVHALLGGAFRTEIPLEWSISLDDETVMVDEAARMVDTHAVAYVSMKVGPEARKDIDLRAARAIAREIEGRSRLGADANTAYDAASAIAFARRLGDEGLAYFEQPVRTLAEMARVRNSVDVPISADESVYTPADALQAVAAGAADVLALKFYKCGSLRRSREIAAIAEAAGLRANCAGVASCSYLEAITAAHLCASIPNHAFGAEFMMGLPAIWEDPIVANRPIDIRPGGVCNVPQGPGLGAEMDLEGIDRHALARIVVDSRSG